VNNLTVHITWTGRSVRFISNIQWSSAKKTILGTDEKWS